MIGASARNDSVARWCPAGPRRLDADFREPLATGRVADQRSGDMGVCIISTYDKQTNKRTLTTENTENQKEVNRKMQQLGDRKDRPTVESLVQQQIQDQADRIDSANALVENFDTLEYGANIDNKAFLQE